MEIDMIDTEVKQFTWYNQRTGYRYMIMWKEDGDGNRLGDTRRFKRKLNPLKAKTGGHSI